MSTTTRSYPNPVLGNGDNYRITLDQSVISFSEVEKDNQNFYCTITLDLDDEIIMNLIKEQKAAFFCEIDCIKTNYRTSSCAYDKTLYLEIPRACVVDNVDINCYIVAMKPIEDFSHPDFNEMYEGVTFSLEEGDFIAILGSFYFNATVKYSNCPAPSSLMQVQRATPESNITQITFVSDEERIFIIMPPELFEIYTRVCGQNTNADELFISNIAVNALAYALMTVHDNTTKLAENLRNLLKKNNLEIDDKHPEKCFGLARKLLEDDGVDPYTTFMKKVEAVINNKPTENGITE